MLLVCPQWELCRNTCLSRLHTGFGRRRSVTRQRFTADRTSAPEPPHCPHCHPAPESAVLLSWLFADGPLQGYPQGPLGHQLLDDMKGTRAPGGCGSRRVWELATRARLGITGPGSVGMRKVKAPPSSNENAWPSPPPPAKCPYKSCGIDFGRHTYRVARH